MRRRTLVLPIAAILLASACGSDTTEPADPPSPTVAATSTSPTPDPEPEPEPTSAPPPPAPAPATVSIAEFDFAPDPIEVAVGGSITWTNEDSTAHTASVAGGGPDTGAIRGGESATLSFDQPGTFDYVCQFHPGSMTGTIVVR